MKRIEMKRFVMEREICVEETFVEETCVEETRDEKKPNEEKIASVSSGNLRRETRPLSVCSRNRTHLSFALLPLCTERIPADRHLNYC